MKVRIKIEIIVDHEVVNESINQIKTYFPELVGHDIENIETEIHEE